MKATAFATLWVVVPYTAIAKADSPFANWLAKRLDSSSPSSTALGNYIAGALGYSSSTPSTTETSSTANSSSSTQSLTPSHQYANSSSALVASSSPVSSETSDSISTSLTPSSSDSLSIYSSTSTSADPISSALVSSSPISSHGHISSSSYGSAHASSNTSSSHTVTAVYSRTHVSVIGTRSSWTSSEASHYKSANASLHSSSPLPVSQSHIHGTGYETLNSTIPHLSSASANLSSSSLANYPINSSTLHDGSTASASTSLLGTGVYSGNSTLPHTSSGIIGTGTYGGNSSLPHTSSGILGTGQSYPLPNGTVSAPPTLGTGLHHNGTNATATIPRTGFGYSYAQACNQASVDWSSSWMRTQIVPDSIVTDTAEPVDSNEVFSLCDGIPRVGANISTSFSPYTSWSVLPPSTLSHAPPKPNCTVVPSDCSSLLSSYSTAHGVPESVTLGRIHPYISYIQDDWPRCTTNPIPSGKPGADCAIYGQNVQLFHWPQAWADIDGTPGEGEYGYCLKLWGQRESLTLGPTIPGQPNTAVSGTVTFTSPTVYIHYTALSAKDYGDHPVGPTLYDSWIALDSTSVSTKVPYFWTSIPWEGKGGLMEIAMSTGIINAKMEHGYTGINLNFADEHLPLHYPDLADPLPALPYFQRRVKMAYHDDRCWMGGCPTLLPSNTPVLAIPDAARFLVPEWNSCTLPWGALDDPPMALVQQTSIVTPTTPIADAPTTAAEPAGNSVLPAQQTAGARLADNGVAAARTSEQDAPAPAPTAYDDRTPTKQNNEPEGKQQNDDNSNAGPATPVDNQPSRTSTTQDVAGLIVSLLNGAGTQTTAGSANGANGGDASAGESNNNAGGQSNAQDDNALPASNESATSNSQDDAGGQANEQGGIAPPASNDGASSNNQGNVGQSSDDLRSGDAGAGGQSNNQGSDDEPAQMLNNGADAGGLVNDQGSNSQPAPILNNGADAGGLSNDPDSDTQPAPILNNGADAGGLSHDLDSDNQPAPAPNSGGGGSGSPGDGPTAGGNQDQGVAGPVGDISVDDQSGGQAGGAGGIADGGDNIKTSFADDDTPTGNVIPAGDNEVEFTVGSDTFTAGAASGSGEGVVVGSETLTRGAAGTTINGHTVSVGHDGAVNVDGTPAGQVDAAPTPAPTGNGGEQGAATPITLGSGNVVTAQPVPGGLGNEVVIGTQTLSAGGAGAVVDGHSISVGPDGQVAVDGSAAGTIALQNPPTGGVPFLVSGSSGVFVLGDKTLSGDGAVATMDVSIGGHGKMRVGDTHADDTVTVPFNDLTGAAALLTVGSETVFAAPTTLAGGEAAAIIAGQTITSGAAASNIDGTLISLGSDGLVVQTAKSTAAFSASSALITAGAEVLTASKTVLAGGQTVAIVGSHTLRLNGPMQTIADDVFSFSANGLVKLGDATMAGFAESATLLTIDGETMLARYTVSGGKTQAIVDGETLTLGGPAETANGARISLGRNGIVIGRGGDAESITSGNGPTVSAAEEIQATATTVDGGTSNDALGRSPANAAILMACTVLMTILMWI